MLRGTRIIEGDEARLFDETTACLAETVKARGYHRVFFPSITEANLFEDKPGNLWNFKDKGGRDVCLIPEVTVIAKKMFEERSRRRRKPIRIFYIQRCYRYERPQRGRYREFTQFGIECLGADQSQDDTLDILKECLGKFNIPVLYDSAVKRGLDYYIEDGYEASVEMLGAQKQVAGGGRYDCGQGFAIGVDRLVLACMAA